MFEIDCDGNQFEMFESMRIYIERDGRSYNYLHSVGVLNVRRENALLKEEKDTKAMKEQKLEQEKVQEEEVRSGLEKQQ